MFFLIKNKPQKTKNIQLPEIGEILMVRSYKNRNFRISVKPFEPVRVSFPYYMSFEKAEQELKNKIHWLVKSREKIKTIEEQINLNKENQPINNKGEEKQLRQAAKSYLPQRLGELARIHGFSYSKLTIRKTKTRWGSCSGKNSISLSLYLMRLPLELIDYVIMHELVHTLAHNHSRKFWQLLEQYLPGARVLEKKLKEQRIHIY